MANDQDTTAQDSSKDPASEPTANDNKIKVEVKNGDTAAEAESSEATAETAADGPDERDAEIADLKARVLSTLADMENLRRRTEREVSDARKYAVTNFAREMLSVADNLRRAIDAVPTEARGGKEIGSLIEGVEVTERSLEQAMQKFGVSQIEAQGQKFDPLLHQAMMEVDDPEAEPGSVAQEIQSGYVIGDRVLRPAFVAVVKKSRPVVAETKTADTKAAVKDEKTVDSAKDAGTDEASSEDAKSEA